LANWKLKPGKRTAATITKVAKIIQNKETKYWPHKSHKPTATTTCKNDQAKSAMTARHPVLQCNIP